MHRRSTLYHRIWYIKKRKARRIRVYFKIFLLLSILILFLSYAQKRIIPYVADVSEAKTKAVITMTVNNIINESFTGDIKYEDLVSVSKDNSGHITSIETNMAQMNKLSDKISNVLKERLDNLKNEKINVPFGVLLGNNLGPDIHIKVQSDGAVETEFKSEFSSSGINQTKHTIFAQIKTRIYIVLPLFRKETEVVLNIPFAETVIVGNVPNFYVDKGE
jgi:sporulation protein YunB